MIFLITEGLFYNISKQKIQPHLPFSGGVLFFLHKHEIDTKKVIPSLHLPPHDGIRAPNENTYDIIAFI